jgi:thiosulfate dehydrogenase [quinone] large subunit
LDDVVPIRPRRSQRLALAALRIAIGWHFAYEGFYKLMTPGWSRSGERLAAWTAAPFLNAASGPLSPLLHRLAQSPHIAWVDAVIPAALLLTGVCMMLGLFTRVSQSLALAFLALVYLSSIPMTGLPAAGSEGAYLVVNKNLIECCALLVLIAFDSRSVPSRPVVARQSAVASGPIA